MTPAAMTKTVTDRLRAQGFQVQVDTIAPRPWSFRPKGVLLHHTASSEVTGIDAERADVRNLQTDAADGSWPAPHVQWYVGRTGRIWLLTRGGANHAGVGNGLVNEGIPVDLGNTFLWGIEGQDDGYGLDWPPALWDAYHAVAGELLRVMGVGVGQVWRHKDYSSAGKVDTRYPLETHRDAIRKYLTQGASELDQSDREWVTKQLQESEDRVVKKLLGADLYEGENAKPSERFTPRAALRALRGR